MALHIYKIGNLGDTERACENSRDLLKRLRLFQDTEKIAKEVWHQRETAFEELVAWKEDVDQERPPDAFVIPANGAPLFGFIFNCQRSNTYFVVSPMPLPWPIEIGHP
jgi:hypothetical protein